MLFSEEDLSKYDGKDKPMYLAIVGSVFDVTPGRNFYEPGTAYNCFVGRGKLALIIWTNHQTDLVHSQQVP